MLRRALAALTLVALAGGAASAAGMLVPTDTSLPPLALKHHRVAIDVRDGTSVTTIEQVYRNHTDRPLEATYLFPVPDGAVVIEFQLLVNGKLQKGEVLERDKAEQIYTEIVRRMRDPGIVDWVGKNVFRARIFPVPPRGDQKLVIKYTQILPFLDGTYKIAYPLKTSAQAAKTLEDMTLTVNVAQSVPIRTVYSPSHRVSVGRKDEYHATVGFEGEKVVLDEDFLLYVGMSKKDVGMSLLTYHPPGEAGYFLLMAAPKAVFDTDEIQGKAITFVLDTSGSMTGTKLEQAKRALLYSLKRLGHDDRFNVIRFSSDVESFQPGLVSASAANIEAAKRFVDGFEAAGGTAIDDALQAALSAKVGGNDPHLVLFLTDGRPTVGETEESAILKRAAALNGAHGARVFALGIGEDLNTHLLDQLAAEHGGTSAYVAPGEDMDAEIAALYNQIAFPVLTDIELQIPKVKTYAVLPGSLPDIFRGGQLLVVGRYRDDGDSLIRLSGRMGGEERRFDYEGTFPKATLGDNEFIAALWAHRQVGVLLDQIRLRGETPELREEVVQLAKKFGIVTPYTSYLVVEDGVTGGAPPPPMTVPRPERAPRFDARPRGASAEPEPAAAPPGDLDEEAAERVVVETAKATSGSKRDGSGTAGGAFSAKSGKEAVDAAKAVRHMKEKDRATSDVRGVKYVAGRVFTFRGDRWVDESATGGLEEVAVAPYSAAWMKLASEIAWLRDAFALGENVTVRVGRYKVVVRAGGEATLDAAKVQRIKASR
ncbi:MAG: VWA domain-containing protein [Deltaproteobacteria bacterium]|nr:VWA domain-containing protein [Deltaproteobacteria bacterium]